MDANAFEGKRIVILGLARQGLALARFFIAAGAQVTVSDAAPAARLGAELEKLGGLPVQLVLGGHPLTLLDGCDLLCLSGGVPAQLPIVQSALAAHIPLSNDSLLTLQLAASRGLGPVVAITGSSGKTTTTTLTGLMLQASGLTTHVGGNIGRPLIDRLDAINPGEPLVLELSSFQLELFDASVAYGGLDHLALDVAAILNITPNHLDRHADMRAYADAKFNLLRRLRGGAAVLGADDAVTGAVLGSTPAADDPAQQARLAAWNLRDLTAALQHELSERMSKADVRLLAFSREHICSGGAWLAPTGDTGGSPAHPLTPLSPAGESPTLVYRGQPICTRAEVKLRGEHNISNLLAAMTIAGAAGATAAAMGEVARTFSGVPHRLEIVAEAGGVTWINDSIATSPERAVAGLRSFGRASGGALILLVGGKDKNLPWEALAAEVVERVDVLIGFGQAGPMIVEKVQEYARFAGRRAPNSAITRRLDEAVELAGRAAEAGAVVLLSPGGTSYDAYKDFEERGEHFRRLVQQVTQGVTR